MSAGMENIGMRAILSALLLCVLVPMSLPASTAAQGMNPNSGKGDNSFQYVPPSARQSVEIGNFYFSRKDFRGALSRYQEAARDDPYYAPAYLGLGKVYEKMRKKREALAAYRKYLDALPSQKQADEATSVHKAIKHLELQMHAERHRSNPVHASAAAAGK